MGSISYKLLSTFRSIDYLTGFIKGIQSLIDQKNYYVLNEVFKVIDRVFGKKTFRNVLKKLMNNSKPTNQIDNNVQESFMFSY